MKINIGPQLIGPQPISTDLTDLIGEGCVLALFFGLTGKDRSSCKNDAVIYGASFVKGAKGYGLLFDGVNDYVNCGNKESLNLTSELTLACFVNPSGANEDGYLISKGNPTVAVLYNLYFKGSTDQIGIWDQGSFKGSNAVFTEVNTWLHAALTIKGRNVKFYKNGKQVGEANLSNLLQNSTENLLLGNRVGGTTASHFFAGILDEVFIFNRQLTAHEIQKLILYGAL